ncbi:hypothetical protein [Hymenobacter persicinus]|uniref:Uncharacterized protein n=1 Tax=Hymenobacter persicinus TaxID=2025506 RepID=A0A4Q5L8M4_9BACT|nr:hypothetical protein [Hymenobacter persicinus]RYU78010.1 hypothetical protein EWM57_15695 [Hymenobacter persicinus]
MIRSFTHRLLPVCLLLLTLLAAHAAVAQELGAPSSRRCRWVRLAPGRDTTSFALPDTLTVVPTSVNVDGRSLAYDARTDQYRYVQPGRRLPSPEPGQPDLILAPGPDSVLVCYRVLPVQLTAARYRRPRSLMDSLGFTRRLLQYDDFAVKEQILSTPGISKTGNLSRGVSFGNTQNVFVNSSLNLQLEGKLTDKINLTAAISDQNVPFQPEGNTQQLQEFDRIYITLSHPNWNLTAGDVVLRNKPDYFLRFYKNVQGAAAEVNLGAPRRRSSSVVAAGVAKGKFASIDIPSLENVQGPYRLRGPNGEQFIIVLANSERVYLDGRLMTRGFDFDYVIDYNQAEVTFSPKHLITRNSRIKVDFEYSDFNYSRSLTHLSHYQELGRLSVHANYYREADNPDNSPNLTLTAAEKDTLRKLPGNVSQLSLAGGVRASYDRQQVQYNRVVVTDPGTGLPVETFVYPPTDSTNVYNVRFTQVGTGQGDYSLSTENANANGRVFKYVGPNRGSYRAERLIPTPLQKQLVSIGTSYRVDSTATVFVDVASSQLDLNRFSPAADQGQAFRVGYAVLDRPLNLPVLKDYKLRSTLDYEYTSHRFAPIDRYRDVEFDRNWSTTSTTQGNAVRRAAREDNIFNFSVGAVKDINNNFNYRLSRRYRAGEVSGVQNWLDVARKIGDVEVRSGLFLLSSEAGRRHSSWARGEATARYVRGPVVPGYAYRFDKNRVALPNGDSLTSANYYDEHAFFLQSQDSAKTRFRLDYTYRRDQAPTGNELRERGRAQTWQGTFTSRLGQYQDLNVLLAYRDLAARDSARQRTVLSKIDWNASFFENVLRSELSYSIATGRELKRDYSFIPVVNGQGTHYYGGDANGNGRQDKEEFFEAQTPDAQYRTHIKVYLPTDDYIIAFTNRFSYRLTTNAPRQWRDADGLLSLLGRFSVLTTVTLDRRTTDTSLSSRLNPFAFQTDDLFLLSLNKLLRNTLYFNRSNPIFGAEFTVQQTQQKVLLTNGTDTRNLASQQVLLRRTLAQSFTGRLSTSRSVRASLSNYLANLPDAQAARDFRLLIYEVAPELSYQPSNSLRFTGTYLHTTKRNTREGINKDTRGTFNELGLETRLSQVSKRTVTGAVRYVGVGFKGGSETSLVGLEILNALRPGSNYTWNLNLEQRLSNGLNVTVAYDGRKANGLNAVHTGRMQVSVLF